VGRVKGVVGFAVIERFLEGPRGRKTAGVRTPGGAGDARWGFPAVWPARRAVRGSRGRVRGVGDDAVGKEVQALEDGGDPGPSRASGSNDERIGDHGDDSTPALASGTGQDVNEEHPGE